MTERPSKRVSRSVTFYPTPADQHLLAELDRLAAVHKMPFSDLCKQLCRAALQQGLPATPHTVRFTPGEKEWAQQLPAPPNDLAFRVQHLEQVVAQLQSQPRPLTRQDIEQIIQQYLPAPAVPPPPPAPPDPTTDPLLAELGALLVDEF
jgi:hypothetical protein